MTAGSIVLLLSLFGPSILASRGIGRRGTWFGLAALAVLCGTLYGLGSCAATVATIHEVPRNVSGASYFAEGIGHAIYIIVFGLGCIPAGFFAKRATPPTTPQAG